MRDRQHDIDARRAPPGAGLPPGQRAVTKFPRFGVHLSARNPRVPPNPLIEIRGAVERPIDIACSDLAAMPRSEIVADFHCVAGWTARGVRWEGVPFRALYETIGAYSGVTHVLFAGLDGYRSVLWPIVRPHPRARVWEEERHRYLPAGAVRWVYREAILPVAAWIGKRGSKS